MPDYLDESFDAAAAAGACSRWIRGWFDVNGPECKAIVGISGGKDSSVVAALCCEALGRDRVLGVMMPDGGQADIWASEMLVSHLGIEHVVFDIGAATGGMQSGLGGTMVEASEQALVNMPARIRMAALYMVSQSVGGRVANTCNLSEDWVGYATRWGDSAGDFSPLANFTVGEVKAIGRALGLPEELVEKPPSDGLCGKTDEDNLGFSYAELDRLIRIGTSGEGEVDKRIGELHDKNKFKLEPISSFRIAT